MSEATGTDAQGDPRGDPQNDPQNDPQTLRWFIGVAEAPSFSKAAAELGIARQRLSAAMLGLEIGSALFDREVGGTALTDAGARSPRDRPRPGRSSGCRCGCRGRCGGRTSRRDRIRPFPDHPRRRRHGLEVDDAMG